MMMNQLEGVKFFSSLHKLENDDSQAIENLVHKKLSDIFFDVCTCYYRKIFHDTALEARETVIIEMHCKSVIEKIVDEAIGNKKKMMLPIDLVSMATKRLQQISKIYMDVASQELQLQGKTFPIRARIKARAEIELSERAVKKWKENFDQMRRLIAISLKTTQKNDNGLLAHEQAERDLLAMLDDEKSKPKQVSVKKKKPRQKQRNSAKKVPPLNQKSHQVFVKPLPVKVKPYHKTLHDHSRIRRWRTRDIGEIRNFSDIVQGQLVYHYADKSDDEIKKIRAQHYLPGVESLLEDPKNKDRYFFKTDIGVALPAELVYKEERSYGLVYLGIGAQDGIIYHKMFHPVADMDLPFEKIRETPEAIKVVPVDDSFFQPVGSFCFEWIKDTISFSFADADHRLIIHPLS